MSDYHVICKQWFSGANALISVRGEGGDVALTLSWREGSEVARLTVGQAEDLRLALAESVADCHARSRRHAPPEKRTYEVAELFGQPPAVGGGPIRNIPVLFRQIIERLEALEARPT